MKSETPATPNYESYMSQCYFGSGGPMPGGGGGGGPTGAGGNVFGSTAGGGVASGADLAGYHHQHNVIQAAKLMASS